MILAVATLFFQFSAVPQSLISTATAAAAKGTPAVASDTIAKAEPVGSLEATREALSGEFDSQPDPSVAYTPGRLTLEPVAPVSGLLVSTAVPSSSPVASAFLAPIHSSPSLSPAQIRSEQNRRRLWFTLAVVQSGAASFDAVSTRHVIASGQGQEDNPMLRPFAGNASLYAAIQVGPTVLDYLGRRMMTSEHGWARHTWWIPQALGTAMSVFSGVHNLGVHSAP